MPLKGTPLRRGLSVPSKKRKGALGYAVLIVLLLLLAISFSHNWMSNHQELKNSQAKLDAILERERLLALENDQLQRYVNGENFDEFLERYARDEMGYADPNERVYHVRPG